MTPLRNQFSAVRPLIELTTLSPAVRNRETTCPKTFSNVVVKLREFECTDRLVRIVCSNNLNSDSPKCIRDVEFLNIVCAQSDSVEDVAKVGLYALTQLPV